MLSSASARAVDMVFGGTRLAGQTADAWEVVEVLKRNKVPLAVIPDGRESPADGVVERLRELQSLELMRASARCREVAQAWMSNGIRGVLIKSPGYLPYTSDNVDVLVDPGLEKAAVGCLRDLGYVEIRRLREPMKRFFRRFRGPDPGFAIHLHTAVAWINTFLEASDVLADARPGPASDGLWIPSATHAFLINTAHWVYEDKHLSLRDLYHARVALEAGVDWDAARRLVSSYGWGAGFELGIAIYRAVNERVARVLDLPAGLAMGPPWDRYAGRVVRQADDLPIELSRVLCKWLHYRMASRSPRTGWAERGRDVAELTRYAVLVKAPWLRRSRSLIVAISGPDGAGKSSLAHEVVRRCQAFGLPARSHWVRAGSSSFLELIKAVALRRGERPALVSDREEALSRPVLGSGWRWMVAFDAGLRLWAKSVRAREVGGVHVFDRYVADACADLTSRYQSGGASLLRRWGPRPDLAVLIDLNGEEASRRSESPLRRETLDTTIAWYRAHPGLFDVVVAGALSADRVAEQVCERVFGVYAG